MDYKMTADDLKFVELRGRLARDVIWKLNKVYYSLPYPSPDKFDLTCEVGTILETVEDIMRDIEKFVASKAQANRDGI